MGQATGWVVRVLAGLLAAGVIAPFIVRLPDRYMPWGIVALTTVGCVATALLAGRRSSPRR